MTDESTLVYERGIAWISNVECIARTTSLLACGTLVVVEDAWRTRPAHSESGTNRQRSEIVKTGQGSFA